MLLVGTQMKYLVGRDALWMISTQPTTIGQLCGTRNTMENCYSCPYFIHVASQCAGRWLWFILDQRQLASYNARAMSYTLDEWGGDSLCLQELINMKQFSLTVCADRQRALQSPQTVSYGPQYSQLSALYLLMTNLHPLSLSLSPSISMARVNMVNI